MKSYRIWTSNHTIKFAGTGNDSWFIDIETAKNKCDYNNGEMIYEYNEKGEKLWEVL